jgi:hypothetical protein
VLLEISEIKRFLSTKASNAYNVNYIRPFLVLQVHKGSVADPHHVDADPDSTYHSNADPDYDFYLMRIRIRIYPTFHPDADPDPDPNFQIKAQTLSNGAQIGSYYTTLHKGAHCAGNGT